ncbi:hypothetical protein [Aquirhabdus sp.]|uniref:hypothetical protein n=1 Tax=Aquirhabdus sp. TaxID=2824160 RepID=UPI00396CE4C6
MSHHDLDAYKAKHELIACKKILVNKVLNNSHVKSSQALVEKIKQISLELEECMAAINTVLYSQDKTANSSTIALDEFNEHYWRLKPEGTTHVIFDEKDNTVYWGKTSKANVQAVKDIQYIWSLSSWSDHHHLLKKEGADASHIVSPQLKIVKFPRIDQIAIRYNGQVNALPMPSEYGAIYENLYKRGFEPTPFDAEQGFIHPLTHEFIDAKEAIIYAKYIGMLPEDSDVSQLVPAMIV